MNVHARLRDVHGKGLKLKWRSEFRVSGVIFKIAEKENVIIIDNWRGSADSLEPCKF